MVAKNDKLAKPKKIGKNTAFLNTKHGPTVAAFIDLENTNASPDNILEILTNLDRKGSIIYGKIYGYTDDKVDDFEELVSERRFETIGRSRFKSDDTSVVDTRLVVDCMNFAERHGADFIFVWTGVGDLIPLFTRIVQSGCKTITVDLPEFDSNNKFVDEKIRLFSPHTMPKKNRTYTNPPAEINLTVDREPPANETFAQSVPETPSGPIANKLGFGVKIPQLPRKKGAPGFEDQPKASAMFEQANAEAEVKEEAEDVFDDTDFDVQNIEPEVDREAEYQKYKELDKVTLEDNERMEIMLQDLYRKIRSGVPADSIDVTKLDDGTKALEKIAPVKQAQKPAKKDDKKQESTSYKAYDPDEDSKVVDDTEKPEKPKSEFSDFGDI